MEVSLGDDHAKKKITTTVAIIGGGLSGLNCARVLEQAGIPFLIFEQADSLGDRVATDVIDGFRLDRGFQVLLTAYPEAGRALDYEQLDLQSFYFNAPESPLDIPALMLNGDQSGPVNHLCVPSDIAASYAPKGRSLVSATALNVGKPDFLSDVRKHLKQWFGSSFDHWDNIATYEIREALPVMHSTPRSRRKGFIEAAPTTLICGDHVSDTSINGALRSGRLAAEAIAAKLQ